MDNEAFKAREEYNDQLINRLALRIGQQEVTIEELRFQNDILRKEMEKFRQENKKVEE